MSSKTDKLSKDLDDAYKEYIVAYHAFSKKGIKARSVDARKALKAMSDACGELRKAIQEVKNG